MVSGCSYTILMVRLIEILRPKKDAVMHWHTQAGNITSNIKVKVYFTLPGIRVMNAATWKCHVYDSAKGRYDMILGRDILTQLG